MSSGYSALLQDSEPKGKVAWTQAGKKAFTTKLNSTKLKVHGKNVLKTQQKKEISGLRTYFRMKITFLIHIFLITFYIQNSNATWSKSSLI